MGHHGPVLIGQPAAAGALQGGGHRRAQLYQERVVVQTELLLCVVPRAVLTAVSIMRLLGSCQPLPWASSGGRHSDTKWRLPLLVGLDLAYWRDPLSLLVRVLLDRVTSNISVFTDAFLLGWGGMCHS